jgi:hypothetical protein
MTNQTNQAHVKIICEKVDPTCPCWLDGYQTAEAETDADGWKFVDIRGNYCYWINKKKQQAKAVKIEHA